MTATVEANEWVARPIEPRSLPRANDVARAGRSDPRASAPPTRLDLHGLAARGVEIGECVLRRDAVAAPARESTLEQERTEEPRGREVDWVNAGQGAARYRVRGYARTLHACRARAQRGRGADP